MEVLIESFRMKCQQIRHAIRTGDDVLVDTLDREIEPLINRIVQWRASDSREMFMQLQLICELIRQDAGDKAAVLHNTAILSVLLNRYLVDGESMSWPGVIDRAARDSIDANEATFFQALVDSLPDRVFVLTADRRIALANEAATVSRNNFLLAGLAGPDIADPRIDRDWLDHAIEACLADPAATLTARFGSEPDALRATVKAVKAARAESPAIMLVEQDL